VAKHKMMRKLTEEERALLEKELGDEADETKSKRIIDMIRESKKGDPILGEAFLGCPENQDTVLDFTTPMGKCSKVYYSFVFQLPKWGYNARKIEEYMDVSPVHADAYNLMVGQRQKIETAIKTGLSSAAEAVTHYELMAHDARRYREILDYFKKGQKDEHILRSLFVDRVDAYTGEGYSMITMAKRWPTIITDFIRMKTALDDINAIRKELDVSQAEATVLKTKNELYKEWKELFFPVVKERYARIRTMVDARKRSIDEYKQWLKPYITRHRMMKDLPEDKASVFVTNPIMVPGFGQAAMFSGVRLMVWRPFNPIEPGKPEYFIEKKKSGNFQIDPYDNFVKKWIKRIEYKYSVRITDRDVKELLGEWTSSSTEKPIAEMYPERLYYIVFDILVMRSVIKTPPPAGGELENLMLSPLRTILVSQNILLLYLLEMRAIEEKFDNDVNELIGAPELEEERMAEVERMFDEKAERKRFESLKSFSRGMKRFGRGVRKPFRYLARYVIKPGPYETNFKERVTKVYMVNSGGIYGGMVDYWKKEFGVK
jgi:hypothetical protein